MGTSSSAITSAAAGSTSFNALQYVQQIIASEQGPEQLMQQQVSVLSTQATALGPICTELQTLQTAASALNDDQGALAAKQVTSSNTAVATATADATATSGQHTLTVASLATTSSAYSSTLADGNTTFATGSFQIQVGSNAAVTVTVDSTNNTLNQLASSINGMAIGVTAGVVTDAQGARLVLTSQTSGAPGDLTLSSNTTGLTLTKSVTGSNASYTLDGVSLQSTSNTVSGALPGVTLNLAGTTATPVNIAVSPDTGQATTAVQNFVNAYNALITNLNQQFAYDPTTKSAGPLGSDSTMMLLQQKLLGDASLSVSGNGAYTNLASIGVNMNEDGTLTLNTATFDTAMSSNYSQVVNLFQQVSPAGVANNFENDLLNLTDPSVGPIAVDQQGIAQTTASLNQSIADFQARLASQEQQLMQVYSQVAVTLQQMPQMLSQINQQMGSLTTG